MSLSPMDNGIAALDGVRQLRHTLERAAEALASPHLETLLSCEVALESALADLSGVQELPKEVRAEVRAEIHRARAALLRCQTLGTSMSAVVRLCLDAQGRGHGYGHLPPAFTGVALNQRV